MVFTKEHTITDVKDSVQSKHCLLASLCTLPDALFNARFSEPRSSSAWSSDFCYKFDVTPEVTASVHALPNVGLHTSQAQHVSA